MSDEIEKSNRLQNTVELIRKHVLASDAVEAFTSKMIIPRSKTHYCYFCGKQSLTIDNAHGRIKCTNGSCRIHKGIDVIGYAALAQKLNPNNDDDLTEICSMIIHRLKLQRFKSFNRITIDDSLIIQKRLRLYMAIHGMNYYELIDYLQINEFTYNQIKTYISYSPFDSKQRVSESTFIRFYQYLVDNRKKLLYEIKGRLNEKFQRVCNYGDDLLYI